jgi:hypothetical protein
MNRKHGILLGILIAQAALAAVTWNASGPAASAGVDRVAALELAADDVTLLRIVGEPKADGAAPDQVELARREEGWVVASADDYPADTSKVDPILEKLVSMKIGRPIASKAVNHEALGVGTRSYGRRVTLVTDDAEHEVVLGTGARQLSHVRVDGSDEVYTTRDVGVWNTRVDARNYVDVAYLEVDRETLGSVTIRNSHGTLNFSKTDAGWRLAELPAGADQDEAAVAGVVNNLARLSLNTLVGRDTDPAYGLDGGAEVTLGWVDEDGTSGATRYVVGAAADERTYYAKADEREHIVTIAKFTAEQATTTKAEDFVKAPTEPPPAAQ